LIVVAGFNTAIDKRIEVEALSLGEVHRALSVHATPGGKGVHVARTIAALGEPVQLIGLIDCARREWFEAELSRWGVEFHGIEVAAMRTCITLREADGRCTEVLESGEVLGATERAALLDTLRKLALQSALVVLSGSLPPGFDDDSYAQLVHELRAAGTRCLVDASGAALRHALDAAPFLLKPNRAEASTLLGRPVGSLENALEAVSAITRRGVSWPLLSLGVDGALLGDGSRVLHAHVDIGRAVNPVGSGDCLLGGLAVALARGQSSEESLRLGVACGAANAASIEIGWAARAEIDALLPRVRVSYLPSNIHETTCASLPPGLT